MRMSLKRIIICMLGFACLEGVVHGESVTDYSMIWNSPSRDSRGSMPIGNGDIGANAWVEPSGDLVMLLAKTDAWSECGALFKLGRLRIKLDPPLPTDAGTYRQTLDMGTGTLWFRSETTNQTTALRLWVDAHHPVIHVDVTGSRPVTVRATYDSWRTKEQVLNGWSYFDGKSATEPARAYPDTVLDGPTESPLKDHLVWYYRNRDSIYATTLAHQGLASFHGTDPLTNRTFGCAVGGTGFVSESPTTVASSKPLKKQSISIHALTAQAPSAEVWLNTLAAQTAKKEQRDAEGCYASHCDWWLAFWDRSWISISGGTPAEQAEIKRINTGVRANRYLVACAARGAYPVKFNGSIFNVGHFDRVGKARGKDRTPDFRGWGSPFWFQNQRHIYWPMLAAGDFDQMRPFFKMYRDALPLGASGFVRGFFIESLAGICGRGVSDYC